MKCLTLFAILLLAPVSMGQFSEVAATYGLDHGNAKDGGIAWADLNDDGCLDLIVNTNTNDASNRTRMFFSDCSLPNPSFSDVTATNASGLSANKCERSVSVGDYNNDGYIDFCRNTHNRLEVYLNKGPGASPAFSFGDAGQNPNFSLTSVPNGMNAEGFGWMDYNNDGWLDLVIENHNYGIDIYENPADGSAAFTHVTPNASSKGLPTAGTSGDYMALGDYNNDGYIDIFARKEGDYDLWENSGSGTFSANTTMNVDASNGNKGGVLFCDFDNDGDFDLFWTSQGTTQIFEQTGVNSGSFSATAEPATSSGVSISTTVDGCSCGDVDNDGDMDLYVGGSSAANSYLFLNNGTGFNFTHNDLGISEGNNTEGNAFADYDNDGDLDLYININSAANELWRNSTNNTDYLKVRAKYGVGGGVYRDDLGATIVMKDCDNNVIGGIRQIESVKGHGSNSPPEAHFGLPNGNSVSYKLEIRFTAKNGSRVVKDTIIQPSTLTDQTLDITDYNGFGGLTGCIGYSPLGVFFSSVSAFHEKDYVKVAWTTSSEVNNDYFEVLRSSNGFDWTSVGRMDGAGNSELSTHYLFTDANPLTGISYYKLKAVDFNGEEEFSDVQSVQIESLDELTVSPNPAKDVLLIKSRNISFEELVFVNAQGQDVKTQCEIISEGVNHIQLNIEKLNQGVFMIVTSEQNKRFIKQ